MNKQEVIGGLNSFSERLIGEVMSAYNQRGESFGRDRFTTWRKKFTQFLKDNLPGEELTLNSKLSRSSFSVHHGETDAQRFWREDGETMVSYIDSLILDVKNDEYDFLESKSKLSESISDVSVKDMNKVFIVHGHDEKAKERTARFIEKLGLTAIILHEQVNRGRTIIEKIEEFSNVGFAIVLYTPDDIGNLKSEANAGQLNQRARQNVVFEHGYLIGKIGRENVISLVEGNIELPNDISGIVYISKAGWQVDIAKEMIGAGYKIDLNKVL